MVWQLGKDELPDITHNAVGPDKRTKFLCSLRMEHLQKAIQHQKQRLAGLAVMDLDTVLYTMQQYAIFLDSKIANCNGLLAIDSPSATSSSISSNSNQQLVVAHGLAPCCNRSSIMQ